MAFSGYRLSQKIGALACVNCRACVEVCPAVSAAGDKRLSGNFRLSQLKKIQRSRSGLMGRMLGLKPPTEEKLKEYMETVFRCTLCGFCEEVCPSGIELKDFWITIREDMVESGAYPEQVMGIRDNLRDYHNVFGEDQEERGDWVEDLDPEPDDRLIRDKADIVYFTGCVASFYPLAQKIPISLVNVFEKAKVDFTLLGEDEWCCGFPMQGAGLGKDISKFIEHNIEAVDEKKAKEIVFACPSCYEMWRQHYPREFKLSHISEFLNDLALEERVRFKKLDLTVTYHDPCDLGRGGAGIYEAPREAIRAIPGVLLKEMKNSREKCTCCGGGGNLEIIDPELTAEITADKIHEIEQTGADIVVSSCQQCLRTMTAHVRRNKLDLKVMDLSELYSLALKS